MLRKPPDAPAFSAPKSLLRVDGLAVDGHPVRARARTASLLEIDLPAPLLPGSTATLTLDFHGKLARLRPADDVLASSAELMAQLSPGLGALGGAAPRPGESHKGYGTFAVGESGALLLDWYPVLAARSGGRLRIVASRVRLEIPLLGADVRLGDRLADGAARDARDRREHLLALSTRRAAARWLPSLSPACADRSGSRSSPDSSDASFVDDEIRPEGDSQKPAVHLRVASLHGPQGARELLTCARAALSSNT